MKSKEHLVEVISFPKVYSTRDKLILAGLYLSKFDEMALHTLGFETFTEAFNAIGLALQARPATVKNYRDEFDPYFPNQRLGWHKREMRPNCRRIYEVCHHLAIDSFTQLLKSLIYKHGEIDVFGEECERKVLPSETFAKRIITGQAAEKFFATNYQTHEVFAECSLEDTTQLGCGFDFRLFPKTGDYFGVEVKGLSTLKGSISLTRKEHAAANILGQRFFLYVVRNFVEKPFGSIFRNPLHSELQFVSHEQTIIDQRWYANL